MNVISKHVLALLLLSSGLAGCVHHPKGDAGGVDLVGDPSPIYAVTVSDAIEAEILAQKFELEVVNLAGDQFLFRASEAVLSELPNFGYAVSQPGNRQVQQRVVRLLKQGSNEPDFEALGVGFINREDGYWVISGSLERLERLVEQGWSIAPISAGEPTPRGVKVKVPTYDDLDRISAIGLEVWTAYADDPAWNDVVKRPLGGDVGPREAIDVEATLAARQRLLRTRPIIVEGAAVDHQIDILRSLGFEVILD